MRRFTLCITSFALVLALVVVTAVPAFADDSIQVQDGYNVECVPYSPYISSLIVTDNEEEEAVYYSSSKARTYSATASTFSVASTSTTSDTSTDYLYSFSDYLSLFSSKGQWSPYYNRPVFYETVTNSNGYRGLKLLLGGDSAATYHSAIKSLSNLKTGNKYSFTFSFIQQAFVAGTMYIRFYDSTDASKYIDVYNYTASYGSGNWLKVNKTISGNIVIPDDWAGSVYIRFRIENMQGAQPTIYINDFVMTDITNENLDKSLDKFGDRIDSIINPSEPYSSFDDGSFENSADELKDAESALPTVDYNAFQDLANSIDLSEYSNTFAAINNLFIRFVDTVGITPLIFFSLFFGICIFILGRKLSGG